MKGIQIKQLAMASSAVTQTHLNHGDEEKDESYGYAIQLAFSSTLPMALHSVIQLGIFEIIASGGSQVKLSCSEIAAKLATTNPDAPVMLDRILRLLASHQVLDCSLNGSERLYGLNSVSKYFVPNQSGVSLAPLMTLIQDNVFLECWSELKDAILEGGSPFKRYHKTHTFGYCEKDERLNKVFNCAMFHRTSIVMDRILESYKGFESLKQLVDVGGGIGHTLKAIRSMYPYISGINFDLPHVIQNALVIPGVEHVGGDMFESVPKGDAIFMKSILHDWSDEHCLILLKNCYESIPDDGKVIVVDAVVPVMPNSSVATKANFQTDVFCLSIYEGGKERTEHEFLALATKVGFQGIRFECLACNYWVMEFFK